MTDPTHSITAETIVDVPIAAVYQQWLDLESFPRFMPAVREVTVTAEVFSHWVVALGKFTREFDAEITEQLPEDKVSWRSITAGTAFSGTTTFEPRGDDRTVVAVEVTWLPANAAERAAATLGADVRVLRRALAAFKSYVEKTGGPTGRSYVTLPSVDPS